MSEDSASFGKPRISEMISKEQLSPEIQAPYVSLAERTLEDLNKGQGLERTLENMPVIAGGEPWLYADERDLDRLRDEKARVVVKSLENRYAKFPLTVTDETLISAFLELEERKNALRDPRQQAEIELYQVKIYAEVENRQTKKTGEAAPIKIENPNDPESHAKSILSAINSLEEKASAGGKKIEEHAEELKAITKTIAAIPDALNATTGKNPELSRVLLREVRLKEKLELSLEARRRLHNRKIEVEAADGDLMKLGDGAVAPGPEVTVSAAFTNVRPIDWHVLIHQDDLFGPDVAGLGREMVIPVAGAMKLWQFVGESWGARAGDPIPGAPEFKDVLNSYTKMQELRGAIAGVVGKNAERIAFDIFTISMSLEKWDKLRDKKAGKNDVRDLAYFDLKRVQDYYEKKAPAGPEDTIGAYFARAHQGEVSPTPHPDYEKIPKDKDKVQEERLKKLKANALHPVFKYPFLELNKGLMVGDLWEVSTVDTRGTKKQFAEIARSGSWKNIPFLDQADGFYKGYFGFVLGSIDKMVKNMGKTGWDPKRDNILSVEFWSGLNKEMERLSYMSPSINTKNRDGSSQATTMFKAMFARGVFWDVSVKKTLNKHQANEMMKAIEESGYLTTKETGYLKTLIQNYKYNY